jgi:tripartite-type tricarboxylate transporter receptor subunit TctC
MKGVIKRCAALFLFLVALVGPHAAFAQEWPSHQVKIVLPYPPGGASDTTARLLAEKLTKEWGQPVVIDNRPGANGIIANELVASATPDGHTILMANLGPNAINHAVYSSLRYDSIKDFDPVILTTLVPQVILVKSDSDLKTLQDLVDLAKSKPDEVTFGSAGIGASNHLSGEMLSSMAGIKMRHVPYKGDSPSITDTIGGQIVVVLPTVVAGIPHINGGKLKAFAVTSSKRVASLPDVPSVNEALGLDSFEAVSWGGFLVPAGTPPAVTEKINVGINKALQMPDIQTKLNELGASIVGGTPEEMRTFLLAENVKWKKVADEANIRLQQK